jgi:hypothetical protein
VHARDWALWFEAHGVGPVPKEALSGPSFDNQMASGAIRKQTARDRWAY